MSVEIKVCIGSACYLKGSNDVIKEFQKVISERKLEDRITLKGSFCLNRCTEAVSTQVNDKQIMSMDVEKVKILIDEIVSTKVDDKPIIAMSVNNVSALITEIVEENKWNI